MGGGGAGLATNGVQLTVVSSHAPGDPSLTTEPYTHKCITCTPRGGKPCQAFRARDETHRRTRTARVWGSPWRERVNKWLPRIKSTRVTIQTSSFYNRFPPASLNLEQKGQR